MGNCIPQKSHHEQDPIEALRGEYCDKCDEFKNTADSMEAGMQSSEIKITRNMLRYFLKYLVQTNIATSKSPMPTPTPEFKTAGGQFQRLVALLDRLSYLEGRIFDFNPHWRRFTPYCCRAYHIGRFLVALAEGCFPKSTAVSGLLGMDVGAKLQEWSSSTKVSQALASETETHKLASLTQFWIEADKILSPVIEACRSNNAQPEALQEGMRVLRNHEHGWAIDKPWQPDMVELCKEYNISSAGGAVGTPGVETSSSMAASSPPVPSASCDPSSPPPSFISGGAGGSMLANAPVSHSFEEDLNNQTTAESAAAPPPPFVPPASSLMVANDDQSATQL